MTSRRHLYALGEPFGDCATRTEAGRRICGGGGDSTSQQSTSTQNVDRRQVVDGGSVGISSDGGTIQIQALDQGAIAGARDIALASVTNNATNTAKLLDVAGALFAGQQKALDVSATLANSLAAKSTGTEDTGLSTESTQKTKAITTAVAVVGGLAALAYYGKKG